MRKRHLIILSLLMAIFFLSVTLFASFDEPIAVTSKNKPQRTYYDTKFSLTIRKVVYNFRDGALGIVNNVYQAGMGTLAGVDIFGGKVLILTSDIISLADDNIFTRPIFRGIISDMFEEGSYIFFQCAKSNMIASHNLEDLPIQSVLREYTRDDILLHWKLYLKPHAIIAIPAVIIADGIIRPVGNIAKMFSFRRFTDLQIEDIPTQIDSFGIKIIKKGFNARFFYLVPGEEEPDLKLYDEEELMDEKVIKAHNPDYGPRVEY